MDKLSRLNNNKYGKINMDMVQHLTIKVYGNVQGVFFRNSARQKAKKLGISGFVKNEPDGTVLIEAEGDSAKLKEFLNWCREGSGFSKVKQVEAGEGEFKHFSDFEIRY